MGLNSIAKREDGKKEDNILRTLIRGTKKKIDNVINNQGNKQPTGHKN